MLEGLFIFLKQQADYFFNNLNKKSMILLINGLNNIFISSFLWFHKGYLTVNSSNLFMKNQDKQTKQKMKQNQTSSLHYLANGRYSFPTDHLLGKGVTGNVYRGYDHKQNRPVAIKAIETGKMNQVEKTLIQNEKNSLKILNHQNIMKLIHIEEQPNFTFIISQIYQGGSLKQYLEKKGKFSEQEAMEFFRKIIQGYCAVVEANIIHRDLKPTNILLKNNNEPVIIDFGFSQIIIANKNLAVFNVGSPSYMSPQAYKKTIYSEKSDIWSLGAIFYELLMNTTLDNNVPTKQYFQNLINSEFPSINFDLFGQVTKQILKGTLAVRPEKRITAHRIKYLLDKEIIGKKLCSNPGNFQPKAGYQNTFKKQNLNNVKSMKNFQLIAKEVDFSKFQTQEEMRKMKPKPFTTKELSTIAAPMYANGEISLKTVPLQPAEVVQEIIKNESNKKTAQNSQKQFILSQNSKGGSTNSTPSVSRIEVKPMQSNRNSISTISYVEKRFDGGNLNTASNLVLGSKEKSKNVSTIQIFTNAIRGPVRNLKYQNESCELRETSAINNDYFNSSIKDINSLSYNQGFDRSPQHNVSLISSIQSGIIQAQNSNKVAFLSQVRPNRAKYLNFEKQTQNESHTIYDLSNTFQAAKSTKRLSFASTLKQKSQMNQQHPLINRVSHKYQHTGHDSNLGQKRNENMQFQPFSKTPNSVSYVDMRQAELRHNNKPNRPQNTFGSQNFFDFRQQPQSDNFGKQSHDFLRQKTFQKIQPNLYQKVNYQPKQGNFVYVQSGHDRSGIQNQGQVWINQPFLQFQQSSCHLRNYCELDSRNILSLRKII